MRSDYSLRSDFDGLANAARMVWKMTVNKVMDNTVNAARKKGPTDSPVL